MVHVRGPPPKEEVAYSMVIGAISSYLDGRQSLKWAVGELTFALEKEGIASIFSEIEPSLSIEQKVRLKELRAIFGSRQNRPGSRD